MPLPPPMPYDDDAPFVASPEELQAEEKKATDAEIIKRLAYSAQNKRCTAFQMAQWVFNALSIDWADLQEEDVPSSGSISLLQAAKESDRTRDMFFKEFMGKMMPARTEITNIDRSTDDTSSDRELLERFERSIEDVDRVALQWEDSERRRRESGVPAQEPGDTGEEPELCKDPPGDVRA